MTSKRDLKPPHRTIAAPEWAFDAAGALLEDLINIGASAVPADLTAAVLEATGGGLPPFNKGVAVGLACLALRAQLATWTRDKGRP